MHGIIIIVVFVAMFSTMKALTYEQANNIPGIIIMHCSLLLKFLSIGVIVEGGVKALDSEIVPCLWAVSLCIMCVYSPTSARLSSVVRNAASHWNSGCNSITSSLSYRVVDQ